MRLGGALRLLAPTGTVDVAGLRYGPRGWVPSRGTRPRPWSGGCFAELARADVDKVVAPRSGGRAGGVARQG